MRSRFFVVFCLMGGLVLVSCSSSTDKSETQANSIAPGNSNTVLVTNGMAITPQGDAKASPNDSADVAPPPQMQGRLEKMRAGAGPAAGNGDAARLAMKNARPAPDNSSFTSYLTDAGYEIRTFKNHPQLLKVEKKIDSDGTQTLKVFLRDGKVVQLPGTAIGVLANAPAASIVNAAGLTPAPGKQTVPGAPGGKKSAN